MNHIEENSSTLDGEEAATDPMPHIRTESESICTLSSDWLNSSSQSKNSAKSTPPKNDSCCRARHSSTKNPGQEGAKGTNAKNSKKDEIEPVRTASSGWRTSSHAHRWGWDRTCALDQGTSCRNRPRAPQMIATPWEHFPPDSCTRPANSDHTDAVHFLAGN